MTPNFLRRIRRGILPGKIGDVMHGDTTGGYTNATASYTDVTNTEKTFVCTGRPVVIELVPVNGDGNSYVEAESATSLTAEARIKCLRDGVTTVGSLLVGAVVPSTVSVGASVSVTVPPNSVKFIDYDTTPGTRTYKLQGRGSASTQLNISSCAILIYEM